MKASTANPPEGTAIEFRRIVKQDRDALKKLRALEDDEEASSIVYREAKEAAASLKSRKARAQPISLTKYTTDVFLNESLTFPSLFSRDSELKMSRPELMTELSLIMDMSHANSPKGQLIYSIQVLEPKDMTGFVDVTKLGEYVEGTVPSDLRSGYIYGQFLYDAPQFVRSVVLEGVLGSAKQIEIALQSPSTSSLERKRVTLG
jgi:hypothetical protein